MLYSRGGEDFKGKSKNTGAPVYTKTNNLYLCVAYATPNQEKIERFKTPYHSEFEDFIFVRFCWSYRNPSGLMWEEINISL